MLKYQVQVEKDGKHEVVSEDIDNQDQAFDMLAMLDPSFLGEQLLVVQIDEEGTERFFALDPFSAEEIIDPDIYGWWTEDEYYERRMDV